MLTNPAGDSLTVEMHQQPNDRSCATEAIGGDHWGPINVCTDLRSCSPFTETDIIVQIYMAKVDDATTAVGSSASWFKVSDMGLPSNNPDYWATGEWSGLTSLVTIAHGFLRGPQRK